MRIDWGEAIRLSGVIYKCSIQIIMGEKMYCLALKMNFPTVESRPMTSECHGQEKTSSIPGKVLGAGDPEGSVGMVNLNS